MNKKYLVVFSLFVFLHGCSLTPWVKPYERQTLADPLMSFDRTPSATPFMMHVLHTREAARGAEGGAGGGCGCN